MRQEVVERAATELATRRSAWEQRLSRIRRDRRRASAPLEADLAEQAVQRENDEALDALDTQGRQALASIEDALARIREGRYGVCERCHGEVEAARLEAEPIARQCAPCARGEDPT